MSQTAVDMNTFSGKYTNDLRMTAQIELVINNLFDVEDFLRLAV